MPASNSVQKREERRVKRREENNGGKMGERDQIPCQCSASRGIGPAPHRQPVESGDGRKANRDPVRGA